MNTHDTTLTPTTLTVFDGENQLPVSVDLRGQFVIARPAADGSTDFVARATFAELKTYAENLEKRNAAKARSGIEVTVLAGRYGKEIKPVTGRLFGMADGQNRVLQSGFGKDHTVSAYDTVYKPFTPEDAAELARLNAAEDAASKARATFLTDRQLGRARDVAQEAARQ